MVKFSAIVVAFVIIQAQAKNLNVLFIGNSYTYYHDVPKQVESLAISSGNLWVWSKLIKLFLTELYMPKLIRFEDKVEHP